MIEVNIQDKEYVCPSTWEGVTWERFKGSFNLLDEYDEILPTLDKELTAEENIRLLDFYRRWVAYWYELDEEVTNSLSVGNINMLIQYCEWILNIPTGEEITPNVSFQYKDKAYICHEEQLTISGNAKPMADMTFDEATECMMLEDASKNLLKGRKEYMIKLTAILYRPRTEEGITPYKGYDIKEAINNFNQLPMSAVWSALFFSMNLSSTSIKTMRTKGRKALKGNKLAQRWIGLLQKEGSLWTEYTQDQTQPLGIASEGPNFTTL